MTDLEIYRVLTTIFHDVFMRDDIVLTPKLAAKDVAGWDSFKQIDIIMATEERFSFTLSTQEIESLESVGNLAQLIAVKTAGRG